MIPLDHQQTCKFLLSIKHRQFQKKQGFGFPNQFLKVYKTKIALLNNINLL